MVLSIQYGTYCARQNPECFTADTETSRAETHNGVLLILKEII